MVMDNIIFLAIGPPNFYLAWISTESLFSSLNVPFDCTKENKENHLVTNTYHFVHYDESDNI